jgi:hypothetical protein
MVIIKYRMAKCMARSILQQNFLCTEYSKIFATLRVAVTGVHILVYSISKHIPDSSTDHAAEHTT